MAKTTRNQPGYIAPERLYSLKGFYAASGITATRISEARRLGITLSCLEVGKRKFVRGSEGIAYIERLARRCADEKAQCHE